MIEIKALRSGYRGVEVLHGIDLRMEEGRVYGIVGPNGCGKSTLLKTIAGLCPVLSGEVRLNGRRLEELAPAETAKQVAYLPQGRSVPAITAGRLVLHGRAVCIARRPQCQAAIGRRILRLPETP